MSRNVSIEQIVEKLIEALNDDPSILGSKVQFLGEDMVTEYHSTMLPGAKDVTKWLFVSAKRPTKRPETLPSGAMCHSGGHCGGTDMAIFTFENEVWEDGDHTLMGTITYEFGQIIDVHFKVIW